MPETKPTSNRPETYREAFSLDGKIAIVTGGAGHLGSAISKGLAASGAYVVLVGRTEERLKDFVDQNREAFNDKFEYFVCDVTDHKKFGDLVRETISKHGKIDILVNNAANEKRKSAEDITPEDWEDGMRNIQAHPFFCSQAVLPYMLKNGGGSIINISSIHGFLGLDQRPYHEYGVPSCTIFYATAKGGIIGMTRRLATEYASKGVRVNAISPGYFSKMKPGDKENPGYMGEINKRTPMARIGQPDEIAGAAIFLASDASSFVTGQNLVIDGGWSAW